METAVPAYKSDANAAATAVGELYLYVKQLTARIDEVATQANRIDDVRLELERRVEQLTTELSAAHQHNDTLRARVNDLEVKISEFGEDSDCLCCQQ